MFKEVGKMIEGTYKTIYEYQAKKFEYYCTFFGGEFTASYCKDVNAKPFTNKTVLYEYHYMIPKANQDDLLCRCMEY